MKSVLFAAAILASAAIPVSAEDAPATDQQPSLEEVICAPYGPGYKLITGTTTCVKVSGSVRITVGGQISGSSGTPGDEKSGKDSR